MHARRTRSPRLVALALALVAAAAASPARAGHDVPVAPDLFPKISAILSPLGGVPAIVEDASTMRVEVDPARVSGAIQASLTPSFGTARPTIALAPLSSEAATPSRLWTGRTVKTFTFAIPPLGGQVVEDLYDLGITWVGGSDLQHRAVQILDSFPAKPRIVVIADPSVGDPRPIQEGAEDLAATGSPASLVSKTTKTVGNPMDGERWGALLKVIEEVNVVRPDFVLVAGDLTFAIYPRAANVEYEDAWRLINKIEVPTFLSPGNHDLYNFDYDNLDRPHTTDGLVLWQQYFAPHYYSTDVGPNLHLVSLNTYDWPHELRQPISQQDGSTRSGGQLSDEQLAWAAADMRAYRAANPQGAIVTYAHHDPSWRQRRHPWPGKHRLELRDLLAEVRAYVHFAGHTHEDRVARYHHGNIVETNGQNNFPERQLHYVTRNDQWDPNWTQDELGEIIRDPRNGPLFVTTTTAASGIKGSDWGMGSYWGWRLGVLHDRDGHGYDPIDLGYPATQAFVNTTAERPHKWNPDHAQFGVFSYPSYHLDAERISGGLALTSRLLVGLKVTVRLSVAAGAADPITVTGGTLAQRRTVGGITDVWVRATVPAGERLEIHAARA